MHPRIKYSWVLIAVCAIAFPALANTPDSDTAQLRQRAEQGDLRSQIDLAQAYHEGTGGLKASDEEAVKWFRKAALQGSIEGEFNLAIAYYHGFGVKKDINEAVKWFRKAADQGYSEAQYIIASAYQNGLGGLPKDLVQADMWLLLAETQGNKDATRERIDMEGAMTDDEIAQAKLLVTEHTQQPLMSVKPD